MSIVFITVPGDEKRMFANALHQKTGGNVKLVVVQKPKRNNFFRRFYRLYKRVGVLNLPKEIFYAILLRLNGARSRLEYFRKSTISNQERFRSDVLETDSVNSDEVYDAVKKISPKLLVIWGSAILSDRLLNVAEKAINLHMGYCPVYKGALANQQAVLLSDFSHIGATIHFAEAKVDSGDILARLSADSTRAPKEMFCDLNDRAIAAYLEIAEKIFSGKEVQSQPQEHSQSKGLLLREWVPSLRYKIGKKLSKLEKRYK
jgi:folate-dependent phosphoribosylglycinamide formyltransferase PurN